MGFEVHENSTAIVLDQSAYVNEIKEIGLATSKDVDFEALKRPFRSLLGQLQWVATQTRPDICFDVNSLLACSQVWNTKHIIMANKLVRKLHATVNCCRLVFPRLGDPRSWRFNVYTDASLANLSSDGTQAGYLVFLQGEFNRKSIISWRSNRLRRVVRSTICAETLACVNALEMALFCKKILEEMTGLSAPLHAITDIKSLVDAVYSTKIPQDKRLRIEISSLRSMVENSEVADLTWIAGESQLADCLTRTREFHQKNC